MPPRPFLMLAVAETRNVASAAGEHFGFAITSHLPTFSAVIAAFLNGKREKLAHQTHPLALVASPIGQSSTKHECNALDVAARMNFVLLRDV